MRVHKFAVLVLLACVGLVSEAYAQVALPPPPPPPANCAELYGVNEPDPTDIAACAKTWLNRQSLINTSTSIRNIIVSRFDHGPNQTEPAGLDLTDANEILQRLAGNGDIMIAPTADFAPVLPTNHWNVWTDGKNSWLDDTSAVSNLDGTLQNFVVGGDYKFTDKLVVGLMGTYESSHLKGDVPNPPIQKTDGWGVGAYLGYNVTDNIVFSANVLHSWLDTKVDGGGGAAKFDSSRIQTSEALSGYWYSGTWRFSPSLTFAWSKEWQDANAGLLAQTIETAVVSPAVQIGNTISIGGANTIEPWLGAEIDWALRNRVIDSAGTKLINDPNTDLRLQTGLNFAFGANAQLALTAEMSGILLKESNTYTAGANFAYQF